MAIDGGGFELMVWLFHWNGLWVVKSVGGLEISIFDTTKIIRNFNI